MTVHDVAVIGAGVVGAAIARALVGAGASVVLVEAGSDVGAGTSKANTAILHTGFDAAPGTLEARLVRRGWSLLRDYAPGAGIPLEPRGALLVAWDEGQLAALAGIADKAARNGYLQARPVARDELYAREPHLGPGALGALAIPDEGIVCPFTTPLALATDAVVNGATLLLEAPVVGRDAAGAPGAAGAGAGAAAAHVLHTRRGPVAARFVVNAAGLHADVIDRLFGHDGFTVTPRRGELLVYDKLAAPLVSAIVLPVPTTVTKGVLVSPTVFGNVMVGPTAVDQASRTDTAATADGLARLVAASHRLIPALAGEEITAIYVGLRAATEHGDYQIAFHPAERYVCVGGIRSTGLTASMAIAEHVVEGLRDAGLAVAPRADWITTRMPNVGEAFPRPWCDPRPGPPGARRIVCHCERVTAGEIRAATRAPIPARTLDGLRRRTRALLGRCQGFSCLAAVTEFLAAESGRSPAALLALEDGEPVGALPPPPRAAAVEPEPADA